MNLKPIAAHVVVYAGAVLAVLNVVAGIANSVKLPATAQGFIAGAVAVIAAIIEVAKQLAAQAAAKKAAVK